MYKPDSTWTWAFVGITLVQAAIILSCESYVFAKFQTSLIEDKDIKSSNNGNPFKTDYPESRTIPTFLTLYIFAFIFQLLLVFDALRAKNTIQVIGLCMFNAALLLYAGIQLNQIRDAVYYLSEEVKIELGVWSAVKPYLIAVPCIIALGLALMSVAAWKLYDEFAWTIYKEISADLKMKRRYLTYQIYIALLKFDFFFFLGFTIQFVVIVVQDKRSSEFGLTIAAIPVTIIIIFLAVLFTRKESKIGMFCVITLYFGGLAYFLYKVVRMYHSSEKKIANYKPVRKSLTTFAVITIILILLTIVNACICTANFGQGLKDVIAGPKLDDEEPKSPLELPDLQRGSVPPNRMTID